jgi:hypothetical protein
MVPDCGDRCLFLFLCSHRLFFNLFPFPVCKAQFNGDWYENRLGALNTIIFLIIRLYYWRTDIPCANIMADRTGKKNYWRSMPGQLCLLAEGDIGAPIYWRPDAPAPLLVAHRCPPPPIGKADQTLWYSRYTVYHVTSFTSPIGGTKKKFKKEADRIFRCASPIFIPIAY